MRKILFRGKRNGYAEQRDRDWLEGSLMIGDNGECEICYGTPRVRITYSVIPETVGQFTGLTDKNREKIFEGDIVKATDRFGKSVEYLIEFKTGAFMLKQKGVNYHIYFNDLPDKYYHLEVIGNIHDNPELLEAQS